MKKTKTKKAEKKKEVSPGRVGKTINPRGRSFEGRVIKKFNDRVVIQFERLLYLRKYERYEKRRTRLHARMPIELRGDINVGDYVEIRECRPQSKSIHFVVVKIIRSLKDESNISKGN